MVRVLFTMIVYSTSDQNLVCQTTTVRMNFVGQGFRQSTASLGSYLESSLSILKTGSFVPLHCGGESWLLAVASVLST